MEKINPNDPAMPLVVPEYSRYSSDGMSIRTQLATMAMQGFLANSEVKYNGSSHLAQVSVEMADALIEELNKPVK